MEGRKKERMEGQKITKEERKKEYKNKRYIKTKKRKEKVFKKLKVIIHWSKSLSTADLNFLKKVFFFMRMSRNAQKLHKNCNQLCHSNPISLNKFSVNISFIKYGRQRKENRIAATICQMTIRLMTRIQWPVL